MNHIAHINKLVADGNRDALVQLAISQGIAKVHPRAKCETIARQIADKISAPPVQQLKHPAEQQTAPVLPMNTEADVRRACKQYFEKEGFEAIFRDDDTWHFRYRGAEDSGHMSVLLRVIRDKAMVVAGGARRLVTDSKNFDDNAGRGFSKQVMRL